MLPLSVQADLRGLLVSVRSVPTLNGARIRCADRSLLQSDEEAVAWFACESTSGRLRGFLRLNYSLLTLQDQSFIVATILHEFSHGLSYAQNGYDAAGVEETRPEVSACLQAGAWAANGTGADERALDVVLYCLEASHNELERWKAKTIAGIVTRSFSELKSS